MGGFGQTLAVCGWLYSGVVDLDVLKGSHSSIGDGDGARRDSL